MGTEQIVIARKRPLSVWVLSIANGLLAVFLIGSSIIAQGRGYSTAQAAFSGVIGLAISVSAHATWFGYRYGRNVLLVLITIFLGLLFAQSLLSVRWAVEMGYGGSYLGPAVTRAVLSAAWLIVNYGFLLGKRAQVFFA